MPDCRKTGSDHNSVVRVAMTHALPLAPVNASITRTRVRRMIATPRRVAVRHHPLSTLQSRRLIARSELLRYISTQRHCRQDAAQRPFPGRIEMVNRSVIRASMAGAVLAVMA